MKKIISVILVLGIILSCAACKNPDKNKSLYEVYENISEQTDSGTFNLSAEIKIVDKEGTLAEDAEAEAVLKPYKTGKNTYNLFLGLSGSFSDDAKRIAVSLGSSAKSKEDIFETVAVDGEIYLNVKAIYSFVYDTLKSADMLEEAGLPKWNDVGLSGDYLKMSLMNDKLSELFGIDVNLNEEGLANLLITIIELAGAFDDGYYDDDYYYDDYYDYDYDYNYDDYYYDEYAEAGGTLSVLGMLTELIGEDLGWIQDVIDAIPEENIKALMDAFEEGLKDAGIVSNDNGWYVVSVGKNIKKLPSGLAKSLDGNIAHNLKDILDAASEVETVPDELKEILAEAKDAKLSDYNDIEDEIIETIEEIDLSDNAFTDGELKLEFKIKTTKKTVSAKFKADIETEEADVSLILSSDSSADAAKVSAPSSVISKAETEGMLDNLFGMMAEEDEYSDLEFESSFYY